MRLLPGAVAKLAELLGGETDPVAPSRMDHVLAEEDLEVRMGTLKKGTITCALHEFAAMRDGEPFITHQWVTFMDRDAVPDDWYVGRNRCRGKRRRTWCASRWTADRR